MNTTRPDVQTLSVAQNLPFKEFNKYIHQNVCVCMYDERDTIMRSPKKIGLYGYR